MAVLLLLAVAVLSAALAYLLYCVHNPKDYDKVRHLNGPPNYAVLGAVPNFVGLQPPMTYKISRKWVFEEYRSPMLLKAFEKLLVFVYDADQVEILLKSRTNITKMQPVYSQMGEFLGESVLTGAGALWHQKRKLLTPTFHYDILKDFAPVMHRNAQKLLEYYLANEGKPVDVRKPVTLTALDTLAETSVGRKFESLAHWVAGRVSEGEHFVDLMNVFFATIPQRRRELLHKLAVSRVKHQVHYTLHCGSMDWYHKLSTSHRRSAEAVDQMHNITRSVIHDREASFKDGHAIDQETGSRKRLTMIDTLIKLKKEGHMDTEEIRQEVDTFMFAGHDTTATQLIFLSYKFATEKEWQRRVQHEIDSVVGDGEVLEEHLKELVTLERFIKETLRMYPSVPEVGRTLDEDVEIEPGTVLPKGLPVFIHIQGMHMNPQYWHQPNKFDPDRFLPDNVAKRHPFAYIPFSAGLRNCIGQRFAMMELKTIMATLLQSLDFDCSQGWDELAVQVAAVLMAGNPVLVKFTRRNKPN